ncbi:MAG: P63C domain-containing protein [Polyangiaceae bacterium]|nr:P63C domain-containing protein [Polyangiaceae bacterium]
MSDTKSRAARGGKARAAAMSPEERKRIAAQAAVERWAKVKGLPRETHTGVLKIGDGIPCSVLDNHKRVFSVNGLLRAFKTGGKSRTTLADGTPVPEFLSANNLQPHISPELRDRLTNTIQFMPMGGGSLAYGYLADILALICDTLLEARAAGVLRPNQLRVADGAEAVMRAFARVGIVALIDEATGYQADRASEELQRLVEAYVVEDMRPWVRLFPDTFFKQIYRIHGWQYQPGVTQGPRYVGKFINKYVYERLPPGVLEKLRALNPVINKRRRHKLFQFLSEALGEPTVDRHLASVTTLMSVASGKQHFDDMFKVAFPMTGDQLLIVETVNPPMLPAEVDTVDVPAPPMLEHVNGVPLIAVEARPSEKVLYVLRTNGPASVETLALAVYGHNGRGDSREARNVSQNTRKLLERMRRDGLVERDSLRLWHLPSTPG